MYIILLNPISAASLTIYEHIIVLPERDFAYCIIGFEYGIPNIYLVLKDLIGIVSPDSNYIIPYKHFNSSLYSSCFITFLPPGTGI